MQSRLNPIIFTHNIVLLLAAIESLDDSLRGFRAQGG